uniref:Cytochrome b n=1 Tax=Strongyloides cebus TaxID=174719 RepID=A0A977IW39_9BILA|nr:cytochrome b [Strongyloides cebus]UWK23988.1 cytochrome b [Strongyloides cebus]
MINIFSFSFFPTSKSISISWNFGSMLGMVVFFQIVTGLFLSFYYVPGYGAFDSIQYIMYDVNYGWVFRIFHFNGASLFFIFMYLHFFKGLFFSSYRLNFVWNTGLLILLLVMVEAFMGYVLVWSQMSFWACVVITSLLSVLPYFGLSLVVWIWGGFNVVFNTLKFFFVFHFLIPWLILVFVLFHLFFLHKTGSTSFLGCHGDYDKVSFYPYFLLKDLYNVFFFLCFFFFVFSYPYFLGDCEMFVEANSMMSPVHIVPEWYFLFAYAILRSIPNKFLGVFALFFSILIFFFFSFFKNYLPVLFSLNKFLVVIFILVVILLSWLGQCHVEDPFIFLGMFFSIFYFVVVFLIFFNYYFSYYLFV